MRRLSVLRRLWRVVALVLVVGLGLGIWRGWGGERAASSQQIGARSVLLPVEDADLSAYARAVGPYAWAFPADHGPHPDYQTEWWYYTGNLATAEGRRFGYQFTVFRRAITPEAVLSPSEWRTNQLYMAHFTITDVQQARFYQDQRFGRGAAELAGATAQPRYRVWLEDWEVQALDEAAIHTQITANSSRVGIDLHLEQLKPPALQGEGGLSPKSEEPGNASYYYSLSRLATTGTLRIGDEVFEVSGLSWMDHEFSTSALGSTAQGWDWFGLHLDDGRDLMVGQIRLVDGGIEPAFGGLLVDADGATRYLPAERLQIAALRQWTSPHTQTVYPAGWRIAIDLDGGGTLELFVDPLVADQELLEGAIIYWEGAVRVSGDVTGYGYAELTGYYQTMRGRF